MEKALLFLTVFLSIILVKASKKQDTEGKCECSNQRQPNILFLLADDLGYNDIGYNNPKVHTPVLDKLAREGRILTQNYVQSACIPSRHALLTGRYPWKTKQGFHRSTTPTCTRTDIKLLPEALKEVGYQTHMVGKWALGFCQESCLPTQRGFDTFQGMYLGMGDYYNHTDASGHYKYDWHNNTQVDKTVFGEYSTEVITNDALRILEDHDPDEGPFFLYVSHQAPHVPLQAAQRYIDLYKDEPEERRRVYLGMITAMDEQIGRLVDSLKRLRLRDNTLIIFSSDNGGEGFYAPSDNTPFRGTKASLWEGGNRVVGFVHGEMVVGCDMIHDGLFAIIDWFPTLVKIAKGSTDDIELDGIDQSNMILRGGRSKRDEYVYTIDMSPFPMLGNAAIRQGDWKLIWGFEGIGDGYGRDAHFIFDRYWDYLQHPNDAADPVLDITDPYRFQRNPTYRNLLNKAVAERRIYPNDTNSGNLHLFYLPGDPEERCNLAYLPKYKQKVLDMKQYIAGLAEDWLPLPRSPPRPAEAYDAMVDDTWSTGWCEDLDLRLRQTVNVFYMSLMHKNRSIITNVCIARFYVVSYLKGIIVFQIIFLLLL